MKILKNYLDFQMELLINLILDLILTPQVDRVKYLKIFSNIVDNINDSNFLSNIYINSDVSNLITFNESNII